MKAMRTETSEKRMLDSEGRELKVIGIDRTDGGVKRKTLNVSVSCRY